MNIVVCITQVPDTTEVKINPQTGTLIREGVPSIMNPDDKGGLEYALQLKDKLPNMSEEEMLALLATDGMLVKRPIYVKGDTVLVGFKEAEWAEKA